MYECIGRNTQDTSTAVVIGMETVAARALLDVDPHTSRLVHLLGGRFILAVGVHRMACGVRIKTSKYVHCSRISCIDWSSELPYPPHFRPERRPQTGEDSKTPNGTTPPISFFTRSRGYRPPFRLSPRACALHMDPQRPRSGLREIPTSGCPYYISSFILHALHNDHALSRFGPGTGPL